MKLWGFRTHFTLSWLVVLSFQPHVWGLERAHGSLEAGAVKIVGTALSDTVRTLDPSADHSCQVEIGPRQNPLSSKPSPLVIGARKVLGDMFQSCDLVKRRISTYDPNASPNFDVAGLEQEKENGPRTLVNPGIYWDRHYALKDWKASGSCTRDPRNGFTVAYIFGAKPQGPRGAFTGARPKKVNGNPPGAPEFKMNLLVPAKGQITPDSRPVASVDCSGFVEAAFFAAGLKLSQTPKSAQKGICDQSSQPWEVGTATLGDQFTKCHDGCLKRANLDTPSVIQPGMILNSPKSGGDAHVVIVDSVGKDPLGIDAAVNNAIKFYPDHESFLRGVVTANGCRRSETDSDPVINCLDALCEGINGNKFDFTIIHSGGNPAWGPQRMRVPYHVNENGDSSIAGLGRNMVSNLVLIARQKCREKLGKVYYPTGIPTGLRKGGSQDLNHLPGLSILEHKGTDECKWPKGSTHLEGEECLNQCKLDF